MKFSQIKNLLPILWGGSALFLLVILGLWAVGGTVSTREISPSKIIQLKSKASDPSTGFYRLPDMGIKPLLYGGLVSPAQVFILEDHKPLQAAFCSLDRFLKDAGNCYSIHSGRIYFSSSGHSPLRTAGKLYEIAWRWKPGPGLLIASMGLFILITAVIQRLNPDAPWFLPQAAQWVTSIPNEAWIVAGFLVSYVTFSFLPIFLNTKGEMIQNLVNVPTIHLVGRDHFEIVTDMSRAFLTDEPRFVFKGPYPPFTILFHMLFVPLNPVESFRLIAFMNLAAFVLATLILPLLFNPSRKWHSLLLFFFFTGLFSYGFQFEIERGQFNLIAVFLALTSIWIFHRVPKLRWLSYILFTMSVQLKIYPLIFIVNLIDNWRDWKGILERFGLIGVLNAAALFVLGPGSLLQFIGNVTHFTTAVTVWIANHSTASFVSLLISNLPETVPATDPLPIRASLILIVLACLFLIGYQACAKNHQGLNPALLLGCAAAAQLIPSISFDYTLSILPIVLAVVFSGTHKIKTGIISCLLLFILSTAYGATLFSFEQKSIVAESLFISPIMNIALSSSFPPLFVLMLSAAGLGFLQQSADTERAV